MAEETVQALVGRLNEYNQNNPNSPIRSDEVERVARHFDGELQKIGGMTDPAEAQKAFDKLRSANNASHPELASYLEEHAKEHHPSVPAANAAVMTETTSRAVETPAVESVAPAEVKPPVTHVDTPVSTPVETPVNTGPVMSSTPSTPAVVDRPAVNAFEQRLLDNNQAYRDHMGHFARDEATAGIHHELEGGKAGSWKLADTSEHGMAHQDVTGTAKANKTAGIKLEGDDAKAFKRTGERAESGLHEFSENHAQMRKAIEDAHKAEVAELRTQFNNKSINADQYKSSLEELNKHKKELIESHGQQGKVIETARAEIDSAAGSGRIKATKAAAAASGAEAVVEAGKSYALGTAEAEKMGMIGKDALEGKTFFARQTAKFKANMNIAEIKNGEAVASGAFAKGAKATLGVVGAAAALKGAWDTVNYIIGKPKTDEEGKEVPRDGGDLVKGLVEMGAGGAALGYMLRTGKAIGH